MRYFGLDGLLDLIGKKEEAYACRADGCADLVVTENLDGLYRKLLPAAIRMAAEHIRNHPEDYIRFED